MWTLDTNSCKRHEKYRANWVPEPPSSAGRHRFWLSWQFLLGYSNSQIPTEEILFQLSDSHGDCTNGDLSRFDCRRCWITTISHRWFTNAEQILQCKQDAVSVFGSRYIFQQYSYLSNVSTKQKGNSARCWSTQDPQAKAKIKSQSNMENWAHASYWEQDLQWSKAWI